MLKVYAEDSVGDAGWLRLSAVVQNELAAPGFQDLSITLWKKVERSQGMSGVHGIGVRSADRGEG